VILPLDGNIFWLVPEGIKVRTDKNWYFKRKYICLVIPAEAGIQYVNNN